MEMQSTFHKQNGFEIWYKFDTIDVINKSDTII